MKKSWIETVHPLTKIVGSAVWLTGAVLLSDVNALPIAAMGATILVISARPSKKAVFGFSVSLLLLALIHKALGGTWAQAAVGTVRIYILFSVSVSLMLTTDPSDLLRALRRTPLSGSMLLGLALMWRSIPFLKQEAEAILLATRLEGKSAGLVRPDYLYRYVMVPLAFSMTAYADELAVSLHIRGIDLKKTVRPVLKTPQPGRCDLLFSAITLLSLGSATAVSLW